MLITRARICDLNAFSVCSLNATQIEPLNINILVFGLIISFIFKHMCLLTQNIKIKMGALYMLRFCLSLESRKAIVQSVLDYGDIVNVPSTLKALDKVYHSPLCFVTGDGFKTHLC